MQKAETVYYPSVREIKNQFVLLFNRGVKHLVIAEKIHGSDKLVDDTFFYQTFMIVNLSQNISNSVFTYDLLYDSFRKALNDTIIRLELDATLASFQFTVSNTYYLIVKDNKMEQYSFFMGHGNTKSPYVHDNVYFMNGIGDLREYILHTLETNHIEEGKMYFHDQFPHSDVTIESVTHIVYSIQPYDMSDGIRKRVYYISQDYDDYFDPV